jgi:hypothetical protein
MESIESNQEEREEQEMLRLTNALQHKAWTGGHARACKDIALMLTGSTLNPLIIKAFLEEILKMANNPPPAPFVTKDYYASLEPKSSEES